MLGAYTFVGVLVIVAMALVKGDDVDFRRGVWLMTALLVVTLLLATQAPETSQGRAS